VHDGRLSALGGDQFVDSRAEVFQDKVLFGGGLAVVNFLRPFFQRQLDPNALSIANAMSRKSRLSMPKSSIAWLSGVIVSRGMSQVSAIIVAT
jgi:hypothetical protein